MTDDHSAEPTPPAEPAAPRGTSAPAPPPSNVPSYSYAGRELIWVLPAILLVAGWLWQALSASVAQTHTWLLPGLALAALAFVVAISGSYPRRPRQLSLVVVALFFLFALWVTIGIAWSRDLEGAWFAAARTYGALVVLAVGLCLLTGWASRRSMRLLLLASAFVLVGYAMVRAATGADGASSLFVGNSGHVALAIPGGSPETTAALALTLVWPLLWLAADPTESSPLRGLALAGVFGLVSLAVLAQSSAAWLCIGATAVLALMFFPGRLRMLACALFPALLMVWAFPGLNDYALKGPGAVGVRPLEFILLVGTAVTGFAGTVLALLEKWIHISGRMRLWFVGLVSALVVAAGVYGFIVLEREVGPPGPWLEQQVADILGARERIGTLPREQWHIAWREFEKAPWTGAGTGELEMVFLAERTVAEPFAPGAGSLVFGILAEGGAPALSLLLACFAVGLAGMVWPRFSAGWRSWRTSWLLRDRPPKRPSRWGARPGEFGWECALTLALVYWLLHASIRPLWTDPACAGQAVLLLATGVAAVDARARVLWPRLSRVLATPTTRGMMESLRTDGMSGPQDRASRRSTPRAGLETEGGRGFSGLRRSDRYADKKAHSARRAAKHRRRLTSLRPPGPLSVAWQWSLVGVAVVAFALAVLPSTTLILEHLSARRAPAAPASAASLAHAASVLTPFAVSPPLTEARAYASASSAVLAGTDPGRYAAAADNLSLAVGTLEAAAERIDTSWYLWYVSGLAVLDMVDAVGPHAAQADPYAPGEAPGSLATDERRKSWAESLRAAAPAALIERARIDLLTAQGLNPLEPAIAEALARVTASANAR